MPELDFHVTDVEAAARGLAPLLQFKVAISNTPETESIHTVALHAQVQIETPQRLYTPPEKEKLVELFGQPQRWGRTLRNRLWGLTGTTVRAFTGATEAILPMPCSFDLNIAATKYFHGLENGEIPLLFLFSGTIFYEGANGALQVRPISWNKQCVYRMPLAVWQKLMDGHYPNTAWLYLQRDVFEQLCAFKRSRGFTNWDETIASLLPAEKEAEVAV